MSPLDTKLVRELVSMRWQVLTISLVVAAGVAVFVAAISTFYSLQAAQNRFYDQSRFPDVFVTVKRAPLSIVPRLEAIPGVATIEPRIVKDVIVDWPGSRLPVSARMISLRYLVLVFFGIRKASRAKRRGWRSAITPRSRENVSAEHSAACSSSSCRHAPCSPSVLNSRMICSHTRSLTKCSRSRGIGETIDPPTPCGDRSKYSG